MQRLHLVDKKGICFFAYAKDRIEISPRLEVIQKKGMDDMIIQFKDYEIEEKDSVKILMLPKKRDLTEKREDMI